MTTSAPEPATLPAPSTVTGAGLVLRPWTMDDLNVLETYAAEPLTVQWSPLVRGAENVADWLTKRCAWDGHMSWAVVAASGSLLGGVSVFSFDFTNANTQLGYWVAPEARGRGIAAASARLAAEFTFAALPIERIALFHAVENAASCRAALKAGFLPEGTARKAWRYPDGALHDEHMHSLLRGDPAPSGG